MSAFAPAARRLNSALCFLRLLHPPDACQDAADDGMKRRGDGTGQGRQRQRSKVILGKRCSQSRILHPDFNGNGAPIFLIKAQ